MQGLERILDLLDFLSRSYDSWKVSGISRRHFKRGEMMEVIRQLQHQHEGLFKLTQVGASVEGRSINLIKLGEGKTKILMWSQMHGEESTATRALLDLLNLIGAHAAESYVKTILEKTKLLILPMINPDGAERFERRNAQGIDINRDAVALQTPEARVLKRVRDECGADFGFNLHDQEPRFAVGQTDRIAAIALLAPPCDEAKSTNVVRWRAKQLAAFFAGSISHFAPGHVSRYDDTFDPRAFGDRMQQWGTSTVLVECGGWLDPLTGLNDPEKEFLRKLNCIGLLASCFAIATGDFQKADVSVYESLPENNENVFDVLIKNAVHQSSSTVSPTSMDVGINIDDQRDGTTQEWKRIARIADVGDLTPFRAFRTIDARGRTLSLSSLKVGTPIPLEALEDLDLLFHPS